MGLNGRASVYNIDETMTTLASGAEDKMSERSSRVSRMGPR